MIPHRQARWILLISILVLGPAGWWRTLSATPQATEVQRHELWTSKVRLLEGIASAQLDAALDEPFRAFHARVPDFCEWAFQWRTSYRLIREGLLALVAWPFTRASSGLLAAPMSAWQAKISEQFDTLVVTPAGGDELLSLTYRRWRKELDQAVTSVVQETRQNLALMEGHPLPATPSPLVFREAYRALDFGNARESTLTPIEMSLVRPLVTRLTLRPPIAVAVASASESLGASGNLSILTNPAGWTVTLISFLGIDYLLNRLDANLRQEVLTAQIHQDLDRVKEGVRIQWLKVAKEDIQHYLAEAEKP
ncbi:hypothetical protein CCP4SC76_6530002 [Gammaproteobacteria bacterium]